MRFDKGSQHPNFLLDVSLEVEPILFCEAQLAIVVVQGLFGYANQFGGLLEINTVFMLIQSVVYLSPLPHIFQNLLDSPLAILLPFALC